MKARLTAHDLAALGYDEGPIPGIPAEIAGMIPPKGFIHKYVWWGSLDKDVPPQFHLAALLPVLAYEMCAQGWRIGQNYHFRPRIWSLICAPSSSRKSMSIDLGGFGVRPFHNELMKRFDPTRIESEKYRSPWIKANVTSAGLHYALAELYDAEAKKAEGILFHNEFTLMLNGKKHHVDAQEWCELWDGGRLERHRAGEKRAKKLGEKIPDTLEGVIVNGVFATTIKGLLDQSKATDIDAGLFSRLLIQTGQANMLEGEMFRSQHLDEREVALEAGLDLLQHWSRPALDDLNKVVHVRKEALDYLLGTLWRAAREREKADAFDPVLPSYNRAPEMALIVAGIYAWADWRRPTGPVLDCVWIELEHMQRAVCYVQTSLDAVDRFHPLIGVDWFQKQTARTIEILQHCGDEGIAHSMLLRRLRIRKDELRDIISTLEEREEVIIEHVQATKPGRWYYWPSPTTRRSNSN